MLPARSIIYKTKIGGKSQWDILGNFQLRPLNSFLSNLFELPGLVLGSIVLRSTWWWFALEEMTNKSMKSRMPLIPTQTFREQWRNSVTFVDLLSNQRGPILHIIWSYLIWHGDVSWSNRFILHTIPDHLFRHIFMIIYWMWYIFMIILGKIWNRGKMDQQ